MLSYGHVHRYFSLLLSCNTDCETKLVPGLRVLSDTELGPGASFTQPGVRPVDHPRTKAKLIWRPRET